MFDYFKICASWGKLGNDKIAASAGFANIKMEQAVFGDNAPSGKLTTSFPRSVGQLPMGYNSYNTGRPLEGDTFVKFTIDNELLKFYNGNLEFVSKPGEFQAMVGANSRDLETLSFTLK